MIRMQPVALGAVAALLLTGCSATGADKASGETVTVTNCGEKVSFPSPAKKIFVNDGNLASMLLAIGAEDQVVAATSINRDEEILTEHYGDAVAGLNQISADYPSLETIIAQRPDVMVAGWGYGYDEAEHITPQGLAERDIAAYTLTESCQQEGTGARGVQDPWSALRDDLTNLGEITGHQDRAAEVITDLDQRLEALEAAPQPEEAPVVFLFDSGEDAIFTSGAYGAPQAILEAGGAQNAVGDLKDTWTEVSWERLAASQPDAFVFVDYPGQTFEQKVAVLQAHPATRDLPAVQQERFLNLPYAVWTSGPLNIDGAEEVRAALEGWGLVPTS